MLTPARATNRATPRPRPKASRPFTARPTVVVPRSATTELEKFDRTTDDNPFSIEGTVRVDFQDARDAQGDPYRRCNVYLALGRRGIYSMEILVKHVPCDCYACQRCGPVKKQIWFNHCHSGFRRILDAVPSTTLYTTTIEQRHWEAVSRALRRRAGYYARLSKGISEDRIERYEVIATENMRVRTLTEPWVELPHEHLERRLVDGLVEVPFDGTIVGGRRVTTRFPGVSATEEEILRGEKGPRVILEKIEADFTRLGNLPIPSIVVIERHYRNAGAWVRNHGTDGRDRMFYNLPVGYRTPDQVKSFLGGLGMRFLPTAEDPIDWKTLTTPLGTRGGKA